MAEAAAGALSLKDEEEGISSVSGDDSGESAFSQSAMFNGSSRKPVKKKHLKKHKVKSGGPRTCYGSNASSEDWDFLMEHHRRMQVQSGAAAVELPRIKQRWANTQQAARLMETDATSAKGPSGQGQVA